MLFPARKPIRADEPAVSGSVRKAAFAVVIVVINTMERAITRTVNITIKSITIFVLVFNLIQVFYSNRSSHKIDIVQMD